MEATFKAVKIIYDLFNVKREEENMKVRMLYCANRIKRRLKKRLRRFGENSKKREQNKERHSFVSVINFLAEPSKITCKSIVKKFLKTTADHNVLYSKFINFYKSSEIILNFYKNKLKAKHFRFEFLSTIWDKNITDITKNNALGKSKKSGKLAKKVLGITEETKTDVLKLYLKSWDTKHQIKFIKYRMSINENGGENFQNENKITVLEYVYQEIEKVLFGKESGIKKSEWDQKSSRREGERRESTINNSLTKPHNRHKGVWASQEGKSKHEPIPMFR